MANYTRGLPHGGQRCGAHTGAFSVVPTAQPVAPADGAIPFPAGAAYTRRVLGHGDDDADAAAGGGYGDDVTLLVAVLSGGSPALDDDRTFALPAKLVGSPYWT